MLGERDFTAQALNIENLSRGRPQDNLELLQFMKSLYDNVPHNPDYNPIKRRELSKGGQRTHSHNLVTRRNEYNPKRSGDHGERNGGEFGKDVDRLESLTAGVHFDGESGPELRQSPSDSNSLYHHCVKTEGVAGTAGEKRCAGIRCPRARSSRCAEATCSPVD